MGGAGKGKNKPVQAPGALEPQMKGKNMRKLKLLPLTAIVGIGLMNASLGWAQGVVHSASGSGGLWDPLWGNEYRIFAFSAVQYTDGTVTGELQLMNRFNELLYHVRVESLVVYENYAGMAGTITKCDAAPERVGNWTGVAVVDNGEGKKAIPDKVTGSYWYYADPKEWPYSTDDLALQYIVMLYFNQSDLIPILEIETGNIQVR
jgi:hypothetical protein